METTFLEWGTAAAALGSWLPELGGVLLDSIWKVGLIGAAYWLIDRAALPARVQHDLGLVALLLAVAWPAAGLLESNAASPAPAATVSAAVATSSDPPRSTAVASPEPALTPLSWLRSDAARSALAMLWLLGTTGMATRLAAGWFDLRRVRRRTTALRTSARIRNRLHELAPGLGVGNGTLRRLAIRVPETAARFGVCTFGFVRPVLVVPAATLSGLPPQHLDAVLLHELAHLRRRDGLWAALQSLLDCLLFFHPVARWISSRVRQQREIACDDLAIASGLQPDLYARALLALARRQSETFTPAPAATGGMMANRIRRILAPRPDSGGLQSLAVLCAALLVLLPFVLVARSHGSQMTVEDSTEPVELVLRGEVMTFASEALKGLRSAEFATSASDISGALLNRDRERHFRPHVQETHSRPTLKMLEGGPGAIWTALIDPENRDRFRAEDGRVTNGVLKLEMTPRTVTETSALLDLSLAIEPSDDVRATADPSDWIRLELRDVVVTEDKPLLLYENAGEGNGPLRGILLELVMTSKERPKLERSLTFAVQSADYNEVLNSILGYLELERDDTAVALDRFDRPFTLQAQQVPAGEMLEIVLRMNCLRADLDDTTARIFEIPGCEVPVSSRATNRQRLDER